MKKAHLFLMLGLVLMLMSCGGGGSTPDPTDNFTRLTAQVLGGDGNPLANLAVRVEGTATGVITDATGNFSLGREAFPNGVNATNEISLGRNGVILGTESVVPLERPDLTINFGADPGTNPGSLSGRIFDEYTEELLDGVEVSLFSPEGGVLQTTAEEGAYEFDTVPAGDWQLTAYLGGYHPEMAKVVIPEGESVIQHLALTPENTVTPGDGLIVRGTLTDADSGLPIPNATITLMADTGYIGIPEPALWDDVAEWEGDWSDGDEAWGGPGVPEPMPDPAPREMSMAPWNYDPQYQETTTHADGSFQFEKEVIGYSLWLDFYAEGYLNGNHYEDIEGRTGYLDLDLTLEPYTPTDISGIVVDGEGQPIEGAWVEFVFSGGMFGGGIDIAVPGALDLEEVTDNGVVNFDSTGAPSPPALAGAEDGRGEWEDYADLLAPAAGAEQSAPESGAGVDNTLMQRFRWENRNSERGTSDAGYFDGYYGMNTDADGTFSFEDVPVGDYWVFADAYQHIAYSDDVTVVENPEENYFTITLPDIPVGAVAGQVIDENGNPVPDCLVNATQPNVDPFAYTDSSGDYVIENVPTGTWIISAYKQGFLTVSVEAEIKDGQTVTVNLQIEHYDPPDPTLINYSGHVMDGSSGAAVVGADLVFTPVNNQYGGYYRHLTSAANGGFSTQLIPTEYNVLIQMEGYMDVYTRIWVDSLYPQMDFMLWPVGGGGGPWGGPMPFVDDMMINEMPTRPDIGI